MAPAVALMTPASGLSACRVPLALKATLSGHPPLAQRGEEVAAALDTANGLPALMPTAMAPVRRFLWDGDL
jgi:hypothetical protein